VGVKARGGAGRNVIQLSGASGSGDVLAAAGWAGWRRMVLATRKSDSAWINSLRSGNHIAYHGAAGVEGIRI
jgi:hypothetical protein